MVFSKNRCTNKKSENEKCCCDGCFVPQELLSLQEALGYTFNDIAWLKQALRHRSFLNPYGSAASRGAKVSDLINKCTYHSFTRCKLHSNERLEFLGDKVLGLVLAGYLFNLFPKAQEGVLSAHVAYLGSSEILQKVGEDLHLGELVRTQGIDNNKSFLKLKANATEAILGAIYCDSGSKIAPVSKVIQRLWGQYLVKDMKNEAQLAFNPKSFLQEWAQKRNLPLPLYKEISKEGTDHKPIFTIQLTVEGYEKLVAKGETKQKAQKNAALNFIKKYKLTNIHYK